ncbi:YvcK family protein [Mammaliicoccus sp. Dog046]|uniref:gluconeogenesis factor YvcK family protein n=1 Tax=Mammaliicoccus sp. Dog046 TaxID=3034233 RepID=UPI002B25F577|nr:YvcK family protein [Mammaliicoccus sp. Dog046]WQK84985.1 YvcK family protein [Mammaliicoccus sp. Dog046]
MKKLKVVLIGGGTGLSVLARGLKDFNIDITAIVTVADDGGSTGKIRDVMDIPAPGDIRNVLAALSDTEPMLEKLFQHRFEEEKIGGHSVGNLLLAAMTNITDDFGHAVKELSKILNIKGQVIPSTTKSVVLNAVMSDGEIVVGESNIPKTSKKIEKVFLTPEDIEPMEEAIDAIQEADLIVMGPGSLYTSIIPNLILKKVKDALIHTEAERLYVCNLMTQQGETTGYSVSDHVKAIHDHVGDAIIDFVICQKERFNEEILLRYEKEDSKQVEFDGCKLEKMGVQCIHDEQLVSITPHQYIRHNNVVLAQMIYEIALREISTIQYKKDK